jgi:hypothetical protein
MNIIKKLKTKQTSEKIKVKVPKNYLVKKPIFGYIKKIDSRWAVFGWNNLHGEQAIGDVEYTNINPQLVIDFDSVNNFALREGPFIINRGDCRIDKSINSVVR